MTFDPDGRGIPDTGFKLRPLIQQVLRESTAVDLDDLALEILARIPAYDRETALFQAIRALARESWRPAFIPSPFTPAEDTPSPVTPSNPPPQRDGRQWVSADGRILDTPDDARTAATGPVTPAPRAPAQPPVKQAHPTPPARPQRSAVPPPKPKTSPKVAAIREAWQRALTQRIATGTGHKFLRDCTVADLEYAANQRRQHADRVLARADDLDRLAAVMRDHGATVLSDVPADVLASMSDTLAEAAA